MKETQMAIQQTQKATKDSIVRILSYFVKEDVLSEGDFSTLSKMLRGNAYSYIDLYQLDMFLDIRMGDYKKEKAAAKRRERAYIKTLNIYSKSMDLLMR